MASLNKCSYLPCSLGAMVFDSPVLAILPSDFGLRLKLGLTRVQWVQESCAQQSTDGTSSCFRQSLEVNHHGN